jgi:hypothetical protein
LTHVPARFATCLALLALAGCGGGLSSGAADVSPRDAAFSARIDDTARFAVRTRVTEGGASREVRGLTCHLRSDQLTATVVAPGKVAFPTVRGRPSPLQITCSDDTFSGTTMLQPGVTDLKISAPYVPGMSSAALKAGVENPATLWVYTKGPVWVSVRRTDG